MDTILRRLVLTIVLGAVIFLLFGMFTKAKAAEIELEEGATFFENGTCQEADGTAGLASFDGSCVTPEDYDELYSYENLSQIPSAVNPSLSIAEVGGIVDDGVAPSQRPRHFGGQELESFSEVVLRIFTGGTAL